MGNRWVQMRERPMPSAAWSTTGPAHQMRQLSDDPLMC